MENFGERLKRERERLGIAQAKFAELCGVGRTAQFNYESGERSPDSRYLDAAIAAGADAWYLLTGKRLGEERLQVAAAEFLLSEVAKSLGLKGDSFSGLWGKLTDLLPSMVVTTSQVVIGEDGVAIDRGHTEIRSDELQKATSDGIVSILGSSTKIMDEPMLEQVLIDLDASVAKHGTQLPPEKWAQVAVLAYRQSRILGAVSPAVLDELVTLAKQ